MKTLPRWASNSLLLSGSAYANCGNPPVLNGLLSYTLEAWVNIANQAGAQSVVGKRNVNVDMGTYQLYIQDGYVVSYNPMGPHTIQSPNKLAVKTWHHLATTYDHTTGNLTLYVDGSAVAQGYFPWSPFTSTANVLIGATLKNSSPTWFFQGMIGEVMIWNVCRTPEQVLNDSVQISYQGDTAVPELLMDLDFTILPAADWAGNNIRASLQGGANFCMSVPGLLLQGQAYADCGNNPDLSMGGTKPYTIEGWFNMSNTAAIGGTIVSKVNQNVAGEYSVTLTDKELVSLRSGAQPFSLATTTRYVIEDTYFHFATTYDEHTQVLSIYLNGNLQTCQYAPAMTSAPSVNLLIGATLSNGQPTNFFQGSIQNIRIWNISLEQDQIQQWMYNQPVSEPNLVASFDFTVNPPVDTTGVHTIQLKNGAAVGVQMLTIDPFLEEGCLGFIQSTNADYFSEYEVPPNPPPTVPSPETKSAAFVPFGAEFKNAVWTDLEKRMPGDADDETRQKTRDRFEDVYAQASAMVDENPNLLKVFTVTEEKGLVKIIHHGIKGDTLIFEAPADEVDDCTVWWIQFIYLLTAGFLQALGLIPSFGNVATRIYNLLSGNAAVMAACTSLIGQTITVEGGLYIVHVIYEQGYMWSILKMVFTSAGWWTLAWILEKIISITAGFEAASLLAGFIVWAAQLTEQSLNFNSSCGANVIEANGALPSPA